ncbi:LLM class flavin-dependent oxidoreductase [Mycobacterium sp. 48b]|uniref:LLM class flavin-dependent oxidoreductase n=1 Tax=Mycobacterium sp. 48b TaxID=3400426 RepID=UPI003AAC16D9
MAQLQFGVLIFPDATVQEIAGRVVVAEDLGFDRAVFPDHINDPRGGNSTWHDSWAVLASAASATSRIRIGMLVANPILRPPAVLAKQAITIDHLSAGRLDMGLGTGIFAFDHHAVGSRHWGRAERMQRFAEYVAIVDGVMRAAGTTFAHQGDWLSTAGVVTAPAPIQRPRPPLVIGGQSAPVLRLAATYADTWNTHGPTGIDFEELLVLTARQNRLLDDLCHRAGRDPATVTRALTMFGAVDPWRTRRSFDEVVDRFAGVGISEFVLHWPPPERFDELQAIADRIA